MDERLEKALDASNLRLNLLNIKENLRIKVDTMVTMAVNGGLFKATRELISFSDTILNKGYTSVVLIDENGNPIEIMDLLQFQEGLLDRYFNATNYFNTEYNKLKKARSTIEQFPEILAGDDQ
jgi:hypothetical protein